jgi:hypothetical protein
MDKNGQLLLKSKKSFYFCCCKSFPAGCVCNKASIHFLKQILWQLSTALYNRSTRSQAMVS